MYMTIFQWKILRQHQEPRRNTSFRSALQAGEWHRWYLELQHIIMDLISRGLVKTTNEGSINCYQKYPELAGNWSMGMQKCLAGLDANVNIKSCKALSFVPLLDNSDSYSVFCECICLPCVLILTCSCSALHWYSTFIIDHVIFSVNSPSCRSKLLEVVCKKSCSEKFRKIQSKTPIPVVLFW